ncbi:amino acid ABC transporter permease [Rhodoplanes sp. Z2-YC6860]|uniref:amino acid ABC transporter permease n=1 Tax=Rhodoplanes sp. Z2-YC6860 TaxID=674703 RepID=UPI00078D67F2|nr:Glutamate Aspartate transport system permease protein GltK [Rhodoplanes sp. Z2-YC6860]
MSEMATTTDAATMAGPPFYMRKEPIAPLPPPRREAGALGWMRQNLFSSPLNIMLTLLCVFLVVWIVPPLVKFLVVDAVWEGATRADCLVRPDHPEMGACWPFVADRINFFVYGFYPIDQRWRVNGFFALLAFGIVWMAWLDAPLRKLGAFYFFIVMPVASVILLRGFPMLGLPRVSTEQWGGVLVTIVVAAVGIVASLPLGILLALGRRSHMPAVRLFSVVFIEFVRGVPLITVLFMASVMLPLFVPESWSPDKLLRALVGVALFSAAYMAEVVRAGLQAIPKGQIEAADALGLGYWRAMRLIVLPQALRITIPNIVNSTVSLFKDTTLVFVVGIFDFLKTIEAARTDPIWATPVTSTTGYAFAAIFYLICCYGMSRYSRMVEARLDRGDKR